MNISHVLNNPKLNIPVTTLQNAVTTTSSGTLLNISGQDAIIVEITGTFVAKIVLHVQYTGGSFVSPKEVYDLDTQERFAYTYASGITRTGRFLVKNLGGYNVLRARVDSYTSGEVTIKAYSADAGTVMAEFPSKGYMQSTLLFKDQTAIATSNYVDCAEDECIVFNVTGTFVGALLVYGRYDGDASGTRISEIYKVGSPFVPITSITSAGVYAVKNLTRYDTIAVRVNSYTSGSITVRACSADINTVFGVLAHTKKQVILAEKLGVTLAASAQEVTSVIDFSPYAYVYCMARADSAHSFNVAVNFRTENNTLGSTVGNTDMIDGSVQRAASEWTEVKGTIGVFVITNNSDAEHTYDVVFYGIR